MDFFVGIVPVNINPEIAGSCPVMGAFVIVAKDVGEVVNVFMPHIFNAEIVDAEGEIYWAKIMTPKSRRDDALAIAVGIEL